MPKIMLVATDEKKILPIGFSAARLRDQVMMRHPPGFPVSAAASAHETPPKNDLFFLPEDDHAAAFFGRDLERLF